MSTENDNPVADTASFDSLVSAYIQPDETFTYTLPRGEQVTAKRLRDGNLLPRLRRQMRDLRLVLDSPACPPFYKPYADVDDEILLRALLGAELLVEPKASIEDMLRISRTAGTLILSLTDPLMQSAANVYAVDAAGRIEDEGEG